MDAFTVGWALPIVIFSTLLAAACACVAWNRASESSARLKRLHGLEVEMQDLSSGLQKLTGDLKRLRSAEGMRELRAARAGKPDVPLASLDWKTETRRKLGLVGVSGPEFAKVQQQVEARRADPG